MKPTKTTKVGNAIGSYIKPIISSLITVISHYISISSYNELSSYHETRH